MAQRKALVLKSEGFFVRGSDLKRNEFETSTADEYVLGDLRRADVVEAVFDGGFDEVYQFAADMGGAGYIFTGLHDADIMHNSALINLNVLETVLRNRNVGSIFYSSSACIYPSFNPTDPSNPVCSEAGRSPQRPTAARSTFGAPAPRHAHSCSSTNASKGHCA